MLQGAFATWVLVVASGAVTRPCGTSTTSPASHGRPRVRIQDEQQRHQSRQRAHRTGDGHVATARTSHWISEGGRRLYHARSPQRPTPARVGLAQRVAIYVGVDSDRSNGSTIRMALHRRGVARRPHASRFCGAGFASPCSCGPAGGSSLGRILAFHPIPIAQFPIIPTTSSRTTRC